MKKTSIILSIYKPNIIFLKKQLKSLNEQTYSNLELLIYDDCPEHRCDPSIFETELTNLEYRILDYKDYNIGYSKGFETLIREVNHDGYIAFCDQDDIWLPNKIEKMVNAMIDSHKEFAYCDRNEIDQNDKIIRNNVSNDIVQDFKEDQHALLIGSPFRTIAPGMSIICSTAFAKRCIPFKDFAFDKWVSCLALAENTAIHVPEPLVLYRRHGNNVSGVLNGVKCKQDYYDSRILNQHELVQELIQRNPTLDLSDMENYSLAQVQKKPFSLLKYKWISPVATSFQIKLKFVPDFVFKLFLKVLRSRQE